MLAYLQVREAKSFCIFCEIYLLYVYFMWDGLCVNMSCWNACLNRLGALV